MTSIAGAIVGGGLYIDGYAHKTQGFDWIYYNAKFGIIGGAKMYSILAGDRDSGGMGVNIGLDLAYHPFYLYGFTDTGFEEFNFRPWIFTGMITVGVSFH
ncbi:MAG: hypothetical protein RQ801_06360 [Spirochaetaceae bacterium]|nr:hypothetical protein [Spirochaetaceae bacterium]MDT8297902.1 hypothetical protein [Spirochaetaceae bacterium]